MSMNLKKRGAGPQNNRNVSEKKKKNAYGSKQGKEVESAPLAQARAMRTSVPKVSGSPYLGDGRVRIKHREYIRDIVGSVAFANTQLSINPGLSSMFAWLAPIAAQFESYLFRKLVFDYETQKSASTSGSLMMAVDFDAADSAPVNKQQLMAYHNAVRSAVWQEACYQSDQADLKKFGVQRFVRGGALAANEDVKTYDIGNLNIATQGEADTTAIGELYVDYDVELITPQVNVDQAAINSASVASAASTRANPFTSATVTGGLNVTASGATLTFNKVGQFLITGIYTGTAVTDTNPTLTGTATSASLGGAQGHTTAATTGIGLHSVIVSDVGQTVIFDYTAACTTMTSGAWRIAPYGVTQNG